MEAHAGFESATEAFCNMPVSKVASSTLSVMISEERTLENRRIRGLSAVQIVCLLTSANSEVLI